MLQFGAGVAMHALGRRLSCTIVDLPSTLPRPLPCTHLAVYFGQVDLSSYLFDLANDGQAWSGQREWVATRITCSQSRSSCRPGVAHPAVPVRPFYRQATQA